MLMIINLIEQRMGNLILNQLIGNNGKEFRDGLLNSYFDCLELYFWIVAFQTIKKYLLSNQSFKSNSAHMPSLNLTPNLFVCFFLT